MITIRRSDARGGGDFGWLKSRHSFSFGNYYDQDHMGFSALRVINDDWVAPTSGFDTHGHRDMEIISYVIEGELAHKDSAGNIVTLSSGEFQLMSAGNGIRHSEFNPSATEALHFLQIWIQPHTQGGFPGYQQKKFGRAQGLKLIASATGEEGSLHLKQDAKIYHLTLEKQTDAQLPALINRKYYVQVIEGDLHIDGETIEAGDGAKIENVNSLQLTAQEQAVNALVFDLP